jgi:hypothetical protein
MIGWWGYAIAENGGSTYNRGPLEQMTQKHCQGGANIPAISAEPMTICPMDRGCCRGLKKVFLI